MLLRSVHNIGNIWFTNKLKIFVLTVGTWYTAKYKFIQCFFQIPLAGLLYRKIIAAEGVIVEGFTTTSIIFWYK